jgi:hypothetical protein
LHRFPEKFFKGFLKKRKMIIPKILHFFHFADEEILKRNECVAAWKTLHPEEKGWIWKEWKVENITEQNFPVTFHLRTHVRTVKQLRDLCAMESVKRWGGFALETDIMPLFELEKVVLDDVDLVVCDALGQVAKGGEEHESPCDTGFFGATVEHACLVYAVHHVHTMFRNYENHVRWVAETPNELAVRSDPQEWRTGCAFWGKMIRSFIDLATTQILAPAALYYWLTNGLDHIWAKVRGLKHYFTIDFLQHMNVEQMPAMDHEELRAGSCHAPSRASSPCSDSAEPEILPLDDFCLAIKASFASLDIPFDDEEMSFLLHFCHAQRVLGVSLWIPHSMTLHDLFLKNPSTLFFDGQEEASSSSSRSNTEPVTTCCVFPVHRATQTSPVCSKREQSPEPHLSPMTPAMKRRNSVSPIMHAPHSSPVKTCQPDCPLLSPSKNECDRCKMCKCYSPPSSSAVMVFNIQEWHSSGPVGRL